MACWIVYASKQTANIWILNDSTCGAYMSITLWSSTVARLVEEDNLCYKKHNSGRMVLIADFVVSMDLKAIQRRRMQASAVS